MRDQDTPGSVYGYARLSPAAIANDNGYGTVVHMPHLVDNISSSSVGSLILNTVYGNPHLLRRRLPPLPPAIAHPVYEDQIRNPERSTHLSEGDRKEFLFADEEASRTLSSTIRAMFRVRSPGVLLMTTTSLIPIVIDEASQLPESLFAALVTQFPDARHVYMGDVVHRMQPSSTMSEMHGLVHYGGYHEIFRKDGGRLSSQQTPAPEQVCVLAFYKEPARTLRDFAQQH
ncbi:unnamed protein product [Heligmosomoides polygyrus]|uniref:AAA_12 domain-containing protein n=1 Tax=Heligmosomoides polygyrus TaxID=6339 RepID=A0A183GCN4_HELPZ|nr:unnamed protein product [Heligmosomoides polygyrus]